jgi:hypothetical protein
VIELPCLKKIKRFVDDTTNDSEEKYQKYMYVGYISFLKKYILEGFYYEDSDYKMVDNSTGEETSIIDFPYISPDKKNMICISANGYEDTADFQLYEINDTAIKLKISVSFTKWLPANGKDAMFWSNDGYFYTKVLNSSAFGSSDSNLSYQYLRIKVL